MDEFLNECIEIYKSDVKMKATTPAKGDLFDEDVDMYAEVLDEKEAVYFHHTTAKLLHLSKRVRIYIDLAVSFLCARVAIPTKGDQVKLIRVLSYLNGMRKTHRIIEANG